ncbi:MAG: hypothetical protein JNL62_11050, partial [Bryobacterales bacterium]|nr:hypothetical protein [Bryobacterales bacterium]
MTLLLLGLTAFALQAQTAIPNGGFEDGTVEETPVRWFVPKMLQDAGYRAVTTDQGCRTGTKCALVTGVPNPPPQTFGNIMQNVPAEGYTLRKVRLTAAVRV